MNIIRRKKRKSNQILFFMRENEFQVCSNAIVHGRIHVFCDWLYVSYMTTAVCIFYSVITSTRAVTGKFRKTFAIVINWWNTSKCLPTQDGSMCNGKWTENQAVLNFIPVYKTFLINRIHLRNYCNLIVKCRRRGQKRTILQLLSLANHCRMIL